MQVYEQYEKIAEWFDQHRYKGLMEKAYLDLILQFIPKQASILDLGCGTGEPIAQYFIEKDCLITGIDGSAKMIDFCKKRFPNECWIISDMRNFVLKDQFDAVLAWHSFFHLSQQDQRDMFAIFAGHLKSGGILPFTSGVEQGEVWGNNGGENLYHASLSIEEYQALLKQNDFEIILHKIEDPECGEATVWIAKKR